MNTRKARIYVTNQTLSELNEEIFNLPELSTLVSLTNVHVVFHGGTKGAKKEQTRLTFDPDDRVPNVDFTVRGASLQGGAGDGKEKTSIVVAHMSPSLQGGARGGGDIISALSTPTSLLVSYESSHHPRLFSFQNGRGKEEAILMGHTRTVYEMDNFDKDHLVTVSGDGTVKIWDLLREGRYIQPVASLSGIPTLTLPWTISANKQDKVHLAIGGESSPIIQVYHKDRPDAPELSLTPRINAEKTMIVKWHPRKGEHPLLISVMYDKSVHIWDLRMSAPVRSLYGAMHDISSLTVSPDGGAVTAATCKGSVMTWNLSDARLLSHHHLPTHPAIYAMDYLGPDLYVGYEGCITRFSPSSKGEGDTYKVPDVGREQRIVHLHAYADSGMVFSVLS
jgi:hypothetical protein